MYAQVLLARSAAVFDRTYHYAIPENLKDKVRVGCQVLVPFGSRKDLGYVVGLTDKTDLPKSKIKDIIKASSQQFFDERGLSLARWLADYYCSFLISALNCVMGPGRMVTESSSRVYSAVTALKGKASFAATPDQQKALDLITTAINNEKSATILLYGITGSGKTEVYLRAIDFIIKLGKTAIVLVPEISLTPQMLQRFEERFAGLVAALHSEMTLKQRAVSWKRVEQGEAKIVLGARSAIFAPVKNLGLIVLDEEYETSYKQEQNPKYHARRVAEYLSQTHKIPLILGSATPSLETFYRAQSGECQLAALPRRIDNRPLPPVEIVDLREEKEKTLSKKLRRELKEVLSRGEQAILFINRRGFFSFIICKECGRSLPCPRCSVSLTYHQEERKLRCHRCGFRSEAPVICPHCQSSSLQYFGVGTQRIEKEVAQSFPAAKILRYDRDSAGGCAHEEFFKAFAQGKANVLIGTQMVTKGLDLASVTLVGVVSADIALNLPDFRAAEHTFQQLTQVAGRAGRHHLPGKVIIQTYNPTHYAIEAAARHDYEGFYQKEIEFRRELFYPPFSSLINLLISGAQEEKVIKAAEDLKKFLDRRLKEGVLGPAPALFRKLRGKYRWQILVKGSEIGQLRKAVSQSLEKLVLPRGLQVAIDVEPMNML